MNWKILSTLIIFCSLGWFNSSKFYQNLGISFSLILLIYCLWLLPIKKIRNLKIFYYVIIILITPSIISMMNSYLLPKEFSITTEFIANNLSQGEDKAKTAYYTEVIENIKTSFRTHPTTSFSMLVEIDRELNSNNLITSDFFNFLLSENINPYLPTMPFKPINLRLNIVNLFNLILIALSLAIYLTVYRQKEKIFYTLIFSCLILSVIGIYNKHHYLNGLTTQGKEILGLWEAPEPRIYFSSFSYKNHWSAYSLLILSTCFSMMIIISKKTFSFLRSNKFIFLIMSVICIVFSIFYSKSNSGIILACLLMIFVSIISVFNKNGMKFYFLAILFLILCTFTYFLFTSSLYHRIESFFTGESFRLHLWKDLLFQIQAKTFWGFGLESYQTLNGLFQGNEVTSARLQNLQGAHQLYIPITIHAHSDFLQLLTEFGFSGFCIFVFPIIFIILRNIISIQSQEYPCISYGLFIFIIYSIFDFPLRNDACLSMFIFLFSICVLSSWKNFNRF